MCVLPLWQSSSQQGTGQETCQCAPQSQELRCAAMPCHAAQDFSTLLDPTKDMLRGRRASQHLHVQWSGSDQTLALASGLTQ